MTDSMRSRGMRDILPPEMRRFRRVEQAFRDVCTGWGYQEIRTPTLEHMYLFTSAGTLSPQMLDRVYSFLDWDGWSGERVVLRPDSTIPSARLYVENMADAGSAKLFYVQNVFRFAEGDERREDWQCGAELIGDTHPMGDVELVLMACEVLQRLGLEPSVKLSDPGILRAVFSRAGLDQAEQLALYDRILAGDPGSLDDVQNRIPGASISITGLLTTEGEGTSFLNNLRSVLETAVPEAGAPLDELTAVTQVLEGTGVKPLVSPVLVRDFEYYTGPVFHLSAEAQKVGGGGRYDALISLIGGGNVPASGFALDIEGLIELLAGSATGEARAVEIRCSDRNGAMDSAFALARALREADFSVAITSAGAGDAGGAITVSPEGFVVSRGGKEQTLTRVEDVVEAMRSRD